MKNLLYVSFACLLFMATVSAQNINKFPLPATRDVPTYSAWFKTVIEKFTHNEREMGSGPGFRVLQRLAIKDIRFQSCAVKYRNSDFRLRDVTVEFGKPSGGNRNTEFNSHTVFDFAQLNPERSRVVRSVFDGMEDILLETDDKAAVIHGVSSSGEKTTRSSARLVFKKGSGVVIREGINILISLCKAGG